MKRIKVDEDGEDSVLTKNQKLSLLNNSFHQNSKVMGGFSQIRYTLIAIVSIRTLLKILN